MIDQLLGEDEIVTGIPHLYYLDSLRTPTFCNCCHEMIMGLTRQAFFCSACDVSIHRRCVDDMPSTCHRSLCNKDSIEYSSLQKLRIPHVWKTSDYPVSSLCYICKSKMLFSEGYECSRCERIVHLSCMDKAPSCIPHHCSLLYLKDLSTKTMGNQIYEQLVGYLSQEQVHILSNVDPHSILLRFSSIKNLRILACGGDGTIGWILNEVDNVKFQYGKPPVAILPLGTGNDLSRTLNWGRGYSGEPISDILNHVYMSKETPLDRWSIKMTNFPDKIMNNYMSLGVDAKVALQFHTLREENPSIFASQNINKIWYATLGTKAFLENHQFIDKFVTLIVDGHTVDLPLHIHGLVFLNIHHYAGGARVWDESISDEFLPTSIQDGYLEIGIISTPIHMGMMSVELDSVVRLTQGKDILLKVRSLETDIPIQIDGEPFLIEKDCDIRLSYFDQSIMLKKESFN